MTIAIAGEPGAAQATATIRVWRPTSVTFNSGDTEKSITFAATDDSVDDDGESVLLGFGTLPTGVSLGINGESTVNITDDDVPSVTVRYEQASYTVGEGSSEVIKVILSAFRSGA